MSRPDLPGPDSRRAASEGGTMPARGWRPPPGWRQHLVSEGLRLFFPLAALHAALWPLAWVLLWSLQLPLAHDLPPGLWHAQEMLVGAWGAALLGFLTTAVPEWTDTPRPRGRALWALAALWATGRLAGLLGSEFLHGLSAAADLAWMLWLAGYLAWVSWQRRTTRLLAFLGWVLAYGAAATAARMAMLTGDVLAAQHGWQTTGLVFLGVLGIALARITVPITNQVLDPSLATSPFRPHPGRMHLAPGLTALAVMADVAGVSVQVGAYLWIAAGAAFMDRMAEGYIGREAFRAEIMALAGAAGLAGLGLLALGASRLGAPWPPAPALHVALMGGLGMGVLAVMSLAGLLHTGRPLGLSRRTRLAMLLLVLAVALRALPAMGLMPWPPGPPYALSAGCWAAAFLLWLSAYGPMFMADGLGLGDGCGAAPTTRRPTDAA